MDSTLLLIAAGLVLGSVLLSRGVERIIRRLGVRPADPQDRSGGIRDVLARIAAWQRDRASHRDRS